MTVNLTVSGKRIIEAALRAEREAHYAAKRAAAAKPHTAAVVISTKWMLFSLLGHHDQPLVNVSGVTGILSAVERRSLNGRTFNVTLDCSGVMRTVVLKTED